MQIVINISEHNKSVLERYMDGTGYNRLPIPVTDAILEAVNSGIVLPKEHGRLIDADEVEELEERLCATECGCCTLDGCFYDRAETIIEADRSEGE